MGNLTYFQFLDFPIAVLSLDTPKLIQKHFDGIPYLEAAHLKLYALPTNTSL